MNSLYIGIGTALILALVTALIGPFFVDWGAHRVAFEAEASRIVGLRVQVLGDVDARLLPSPRIRFGDVVVGDLEHPLARVGRFELDVDVAPLIKGDVRVREMRLERPEVELAIGGDGRIAGLGLGTGAPGPAAAVERIEIVDGALRLIDGRTGQAAVAEHIAAQGSAETLQGPWKLDGHAVRAGVGFGFRVAAGRNGDDWGLRLSGSADDDPITATLDLRLTGEDRLHFLGTASAERRPGETGAAWRATAALDGTVDGVEARDVVLALGPEAREARLTGTGRLRFGRVSEIEANLAARQIDLDRMIGGNGERGGDPAAVVAVLLAEVGAARDRVPTGRFTLDVQNAVLGGGMVQDIALEARIQAGEVRLERFAARAPGRTQISASGRLGRAEALGFTGHGEIASDQPGTLAAWWSGRAAPGAFDAVSLSGDFSLGRDEMRGDGLRLTSGKAETRGWFDWTPTRGARVGLTAERLELDQIGRLGGLFGVGGFADAVISTGALDIDFDAKAVVLPGAVARDVGIGARVSRDRLALSRLSVGDLAGAKLMGSGTITDPLGLPRGGIDVAVSAPRPGVVARALVGLVGGPEAMDTAGRIGETMGPLDVRARLSGGGATAETSEFGLRVDGRVAGLPASFDGHFVGGVGDWKAGRATLTGALFGDGAMRPATARASVEGTLRDGLTVALSATGAAGRGSLQGRAVVSATGEVTLDQKAALTLADASGLAALFGRPIAAFESRVPVALSAGIAGTWPKLSISALAGTIGTTTLDGEGTIDLTRRPHALAGRVHLDRAAASVLADVLIGGGASGGVMAEDGIWANAALQPPSLADLVTADLALTLDRLDLTETSGLDRVGARVAFSAEETRVEGLSADFAGGRLGGDIRVKRAAEAATGIGGRLTLADVGLDGLPWHSGGAPVLTGRIGGELAFDTTGRSAAGLVSGLSGSGRLVIDDGRLTGLAPSAFATVAQAMGDATAGDATDDGAAVAQRFAGAATGGRWEFGRVEAPVALDAGVARVARTAIEAGSGRLTARAALDLGHETLDGEGTFEPTGDAAAALETAVTHSRPSIGVALSGPVASPSLRWDGRVLAAHLALARVEAEIARSEALQREIEKARAARARPATP